VIMEEVRERACHGGRSRIFESAVTGCFVIIHRTVSAVPIVRLSADLLQGG
jgi:hypothetical protein